KVTEEHIRHVAHHDDLTQLSNRVVFHDRLNQAVAKARQGENGLALLFLDLDGFKLVNDTRGPAAGDKLLAAVAAGLVEDVREAAPDRLLRNADTALYWAKHAGRNTCRLFERSMESRQQQRMLIQQDLGAAVEAQDFTLAYQPICDAQTLEIRGFEALLRWTHK